MLVDHPGAKGTDKTARAPALVAEVLSSSTTAIDLGDKAAEYLQLPSIVAYLVFAQDEVKAWVYIRGSDRLPAPVVMAGSDAAISIPALGIDLMLKDVYAGIDHD